VAGWTLHEATCTPSAAMGIKAPELIIFAETYTASLALMVSLRGSIFPGNFLPMVGILQEFLFKEAGNGLLHENWTGLMGRLLRHCKYPSADRSVLKSSSGF
jgi:hypothetical protein